MLIKKASLQALLLCFSFCQLAYSQQNKFVKHGEFYLSWGYNQEWYTPSDIHIVQPSLGNDYTFVNTHAKDRIGWDQLFIKALTIPQYNYRIGYFFNEKQDLAIEINFDHTKFVVTQDQTVRVKGKIHDQNVDQDVVLTSDVLKYQLNNGANFFLINLVKRKSLKFLSLNNGMIKSEILAKVGVGPVVPHVENTIFKQTNKPHFQIGGWNTGVEVAFKLTFFKHAFIEYCNKGDYARYSHLRIYEGLANHSFFTYEMILNAGACFPLGK